MNIALLFVSVSSTAYSGISSVLVSFSIASLMSCSFKVITLFIDYFSFFELQIEKEIYSAIDEAREIFEHNDDVMNETVEEETNTEEIPEQATKETDTNSDKTFSEVSEELEDNLLRKVVPQFFVNFIEHCIAVGNSFFSCLFWNLFSASFFIDCILDVL